MNAIPSSSAVSDRLAALRPDSAQRIPGLVILPLLSDTPPALTYRSMTAALASGSLLVREVSEGGTVPNLLVENTSDEAILMLDGEEVSGAKQNRILNSSIWIDARGTLVVPVSCTEVGRWNYTSPRFADSGYIAPQSVRAPKSRAVHASLRGNRRHAADQGEVWDRIAEYHARAGTSSGTGALRDAMEQRRADLDQAMSTFAPVDGQVGLIAVTATGFVAIDVVSRPDVYTDLHPKLVRSYVAEIVADAERREVELDGRVDGFLERLRAGAVEAYPSPGRGSDLRVEGRHARGAALVVDGEVVHLGAFSEEERPVPPRSDAGASRIHRRHWRLR